jgi:endonuclease/exonuclease/phosphatase family metal-dependent hydrolase
LKILLKIFNLLIFPLTLIFGLLLSISGQVPSVPPSFSSYVPLLGLAFPVLYALNILFLIYWLIQVKWRSLIPATFLFINMGQMSLYFQWNSAKDFPIQENSKLKVVSYNANSFGQWTDNYSLDTISEKLKELHADIYLIQEAYSPKNQLKSLCRKLGKELQTPYTAVYQLSENRGYGMCILSKFPITDWKKIKFLDQTGNMAMSADIKIPPFNCLECGDEKIRLYNIHLQSFRFNKQDYQTVKSVKDSNQIDEENALGLIQRIRIAYEKREHQVDIVSREIQDCKLTKIVAGDFNDVPMSYTYRNVSKGLNDAFIIRGKGLETTYKGVFPSFRIDYILYSDPLQAETYRSIEDIPGDHKLILAEFDRNDLFEP